MIKTNKILGILLAVLMVAGAIALVSARPIPEDCVSVIAGNYVPEPVNVTSYYGNGTVKESFIIPAHYKDTPADGVQIHVPKNGKIGVNDGADFLAAQNEKGQYLHGCDIDYKDDPDTVSRDIGRKIGFL